MSRVMATQALLEDPNVCKLISVIVLASITSFLLYRRFVSFCDMIFLVCEKLKRTWVVLWSRDYYLQSNAFGG